MFCKSFRVHKCILGELGKVPANSRRHSGRNGGTDVETVSGEPLQPGVNDSLSEAFQRLSQETRSKQGYPIHHYRLSQIQHIIRVTQLARSMGCQCFCEGGSGYGVWSRATSQIVTYSSAARPLVRVYDRPGNSQTKLDSKNRFHIEFRCPYERKFNKKVK